MTKIDDPTKPAPTALTIPERVAALAHLHRELAACMRCVAAGFIPTAAPIFKGEIGNRVMVVGQAPAWYTSERPLPYSGATGKTLRAWLAQAGFPDDALHTQFYLTSLTKCFPGASPTGKGDRAPSAPEIALCRGHLDAEIALVRPDLILALGRLAATALVGPEPLATLVGTIRAVEHAGHRMLVVPLPHPSGVSHWLNSFSNRALLAQALALLAAWREAHLEGDPASAEEHRPHSVSKVGAMCRSSVVGS
jgi:uracil-DNA glycosylase family 4